MEEKFNAIPGITHWQYRVDTLGGFHALDKTVQVHLQGGRSVGKYSDALWTPVLERLLGIKWTSTPASKQFFADNMNDLFSGYA